MKLYTNPAPSRWGDILKRPSLDLEPLQETVHQVLKEVRNLGDQAVRRFTEQYDGVKILDLKVSAEALESAEQEISKELKQAIQVAHQNITRFHESQREPERVIETMPGVRCWRKSVPIDKVGLYVPGGTAPLFSSVLMLGIPATLAGCPEIVLCSPPQKDGSLHPAIRYAAHLTGIQQIFKAGGIQAIAAMAYGTQSIPGVYKIFGPGNQYVTAAKQQVRQEGTAIDMLAGPSEVLVCAGAEANPAFIAADLLSQAEHGVDSQVVLLTFSERKTKEIQRELDKQLQRLPREKIARHALAHSVGVTVDMEEQAASMINYYAPEHLILAMDNAKSFSDKIHNAGSIFLGHYTPESVGDYASGTNHTLPTNGFAKAYSGVSLDSFVKKITYQELSPDGLKRLGPSVETMASAEELEAHKMAVTVRLDALNENT